MSRKNDGGPAFPHLGGIDIQGHTALPGRGMSLRDWFAGQALNGLLAATAHPDVDQTSDIDCGRTASLCCQLADAMLAEREKDK